MDEREVRVIREGVQFNCPDDLSCSNCGQDLDLTNSSRKSFRPVYCPKCGGKIIWDSNR